jgi:predicted transcriptional regulator
VFFDQTQDFFNQIVNLRSILKSLRLASAKRIGQPNPWRRIRRFPKKYKSSSGDIFIGEGMFIGNFTLMSSFGKRDRVTILKDILEAARRSKEGRRKTQLIQSANLNHNQVTKYLNLLLVNGLVISCDDKYRITERGLHFVKTLESLNITLK